MDLVEHCLSKAPVLIPVIALKMTEIVRPLNSIGIHYCYTTFHRNKEPFSKFSPVVVSLASDGDFIVLDGSHRSFTMQLRSCFVLCYLIKLSTAPIKCELEEL